MTYDKYHDDFVTSWQSRWKAVSHEGADVYKGRVIDYGNREYTVLVGFLHKHDKFLARCLEWLISWWPSLDPFEPSHACSKKGLSMKGDIIEICLAALRAHEMFKAPLATRLQADGLTFPNVLQYMCDLCGLVQYMDACILTGILKKNDERVVKLTREQPFKNSPFAQLWHHDHNKSFCLAALFEVPVV